MKVVRELTGFIVWNSTLERSLAKDQSGSSDMSCPDVKAPPGAISIGPSWKLATNKKVQSASASVPRVFNNVFPIRFARLIWSSPYRVNLGASANLSPALC